MRNWIINLFRRDKQVAPVKTSEYVLKSNEEIYAFLAGAAAAVRDLRGRGITIEEAADLIDLRKYAGGAFLVLEGLEDLGVLKADVAGELSYLFAAAVKVSDQMHRRHNHLLLCPGCDICIQR